MTPAEAESRSRVCIEILDYSGSPYTYVKLTKFHRQLAIMSLDQARALAKDILRIVPLREAPPYQPDDDQPQETPQP